MDLNELAQFFLNDAKRRLAEAEIEREKAEQIKKQQSLNQAAESGDVFDDNVYDLENALTSSHHPGKLGGGFLKRLRSHQDGS